MCVPSTSPPPHAAACLTAAPAGHKPIYAGHPRERSAEEEQIGKLIAENLVQDEATLQMGIGAIPDAVLAKLNDHKNLGIHTEMFSDGILPLLENGAITNACKSMHFGKVIGGFAVGSQKLYDWMDDNPLVRSPLQPPSPPALPLTQPPLLRPHRS